DLGGSADAATAAAWEAVCPCVGTHTSQRSERTSAVQFIGSMHACARKGTSKTHSNARVLSLTAAGASPSLREILPGCSASAAYFLMISTLLKFARGPSFHFTSRACTPFEAAQWLSATTAIPLLIFTT